jgi:hypothetical protein
MYRIYNADDTLVSQTYYATALDVVMAISGFADEGFAADAPVTLERVGLLEKHGTWLGPNSLTAQKEHGYNGVSSEDFRPHPDPRAPNGKGYAVNQHKSLGTTEVHVMRVQQGTSRFWWVWCPGVLNWKGDPVIRKSPSSKIRAIDEFVWAAQCMGYVISNRPSVVRYTGVASPSEAAATIVSTIVD